MPQSTKYTPRQKRGVFLLIFLKDGKIESKKSHPPPSIELPTLALAILVTKQSIES